MKTRSHLAVPSETFPVERPLKGFRDVIPSPDPRPCRKPISPFASCFFACASIAMYANPVLAQQVPTEPSNAATSLSDALHLYRAGKFAAAEEEYQKLETGLAAAQAYVGLSQVYLKEKKPDEAYAAAAKAVELAPNAPDTQVAMGEMYFRQGKIADAENAFVKVINSGAGNARAFFGLAKVSDAASLYHRAKTMIDIAHAHDPSDPDITRMWMTTLPREDRLKALASYLADETNDDFETRTSMERALRFLQQESSAPHHSCHITSRVTSTETDLRYMLIDPNHFHGFGLDVKVNGASSRLLLDTGAGGILINRKFAEKAGLQQAFQTEVRGLGDRGPTRGYVAFADSIQVGGLEFKDCRVEVVERNSAAGEEGLIGADVFEDFLVDLDFSNGKLRLSQLPVRPGESPSGGLTLDPKVYGVPRYYDRYIAPEMKSYSIVFRFGHALLLPTTLNDSVPKLFMIDSGSFTSTISPSAAREVTKVSGDQDTKIVGLNGEVKKVYESKELTLTFGHLRQKYEDMVTFDTKGISDAIGTEISGMLGFTVLRMLDVKVDYRDGLVDFNFDPKRWQ